MIDLNYKPKQEKTEDKAGMGLVILSLLPFAVLVYIVLTASFLNGIF